MKQRFEDLWKRINAQGNAENEFNKLNALYSKPKRFYHDLDHINASLTEFDLVKQLIKQPDLVEFAIWYHDAIYDTKSKDNEYNSAQLAYEVCLNAKLPNEFAVGVGNHILATKHKSIPPSLDAKFLLDIDLSILGKSTQEFDEYEHNIRKEYSWVPEDQFRFERNLILKNFLERDSIYLTKIFKEKYESQAIINLQRSINLLN